MLSIFLGFVSYRYIETIKFKKEFSSLFAFTQCKPLYFLIITGVLGAVVFINNGINKPIRGMSVSPETLYMTEYSRDNYIENFMKLFSQECNFFDTTERHPKVDIAASCINKGGIFIWGDSHAQSLSYGIRKVFPEQNISQITTSTCRPLIKEDLGLDSTYKVACDRANDKAKKELLNIKPKVILLVQHIDHDKNQYNEILAYVKKHNLKAKVVLIGPVPQWEPSLPNTIAKRHFDSNKVVINDRSFVTPLFRINEQLHKNYDDSDIKYISLLDDLCNENGCLAKVDSKNTPLVFDYGHLSVEGSLYIAKHIIREKIINYLQ
ncbi:SGNH hydrolase domain-containing protein [Psychromonas arctica]|uniref:SGNH hydrolase domain-containing protein n=1 Tax=Psychromonas arctica TaxID=168275 RepID=UPI002FD1AE86